MMTQHEWLEMGVANGWCSRDFCYTHDSPEMTDAENAEWDDGYDPCIHCVRLYEVPEQ